MVIRLYSRGSWSEAAKLTTTVLCKGDNRSVAVDVAGVEGRL
jgi:hypothetical protein